MNDTGAWSQLGPILAEIGTGILPESEKNRVEQFLAENWDELAGKSARGMQGYKVVDRTEEMRWQPPVLSFTIERHGGTLVGSSRAEMQCWEFDLVRCVAEPRMGGMRQLSKMNPRLDVASIAAEIAQAILERREDDDRLEWTSGNVVILSGKILGKGSVSKPTLEGRQKLLRKGILHRIEQHGWIAKGSTYAFVGIGR